ncbi:hypothetical protein CANCADRAFT_11983, partial [Tortispora caseinolytica NRRL Y-17796]
MILRHVHLKGVPQFSACQRVQELYARKLLDWKLLGSGDRPDPTVFTMEMKPVYTTGRRDVRGGLDTAQKRVLIESGAEVVSTLRGGQTTFHGPGQLTSYPVLDTGVFGLTARCYIRMLENVVIRTLERYGIKGMVTENPGVWVTDDEKICAIGVHMRRRVTSYGIGLNVTTDLKWFDHIIACGLPDKSVTSI